MHRLLQLFTFSAQALDVSLVRGTLGRMGDSRPFSLSVSCTNIDSDVRTELARTISFPRIGVGEPWKRGRGA